MAKIKDCFLVFQQILSHLALFSYQQGYCNFNGATISASFAGQASIYIPIACASYLLVIFIGAYLIVTYLPFVTLSLVNDLSLIYNLVFSLIMNLKVQLWDYFNL